MIWTTRPRSEVAGLAAIEAGTGPQVLFLHGVGLRSEAWNSQIDALASRFCVTALDMPGHGDSPPLSGPMSLTDYADAVLAAIKGPVMVVGHSMGAMIALDMACRFPDRVRGVVALNAIFERSAAAALAVQTRAAALDGQTVGDSSGALNRWFGDTPSAERTACRDWLCDVDPAGYKMAYTAFASANGPDRGALASLTCPALFMTGQLEPNSTPQMSQAMADLTPHGRAVIVEKAAHMMPMTHPETVNAALLLFAQEVWP
jgi:pimeloyl-ACP methyl ester carboxylesterase